MPPAVAVFAPFSQSDAAARCWCCLPSLGSLLLLLLVVLVVKEVDVFMLAELLLMLSLLRME